MKNLHRLLFTALALFLAAATFLGLSSTAHAQGPVLSGTYTTTLTTPFTMTLSSGTQVVLPVGTILVATVPTTTTVPNAYYISTQQWTLPNYAETQIRPNSGKLLSPWGEVFDEALFSGITSTVKFNLDWRNGSRSIIIDPATPALITAFKAKLARPVMKEWWVDPSKDCGKAQYWDDPTRAKALYAHIYLGEWALAPGCVQ